MPKPEGLGPRLVAIQEAKISKEEASKQIAAQTAAGVPPSQMTLTNPKTGAIVPANIEKKTATATSTTARYQFLGIDITNIIIGWNEVMDKLGIKGGKVPLGQSYKTNQWDGTINDLERGR